MFAIQPTVFYEELKFEVYVDIGGGNKCTLYYTYHNMSSDMALMLMHGAVKKVYSTATVEKEVCTYAKVKEVR